MTQTSLVKGVVVKLGVDLNQFDFWIRPRTAGKETQILSFIRLL